MELFKQQLGQDSKIKELTLRSQIDFKERQVGEFYGPIYAMLKRGDAIYPLWTLGKLDEIDRKLQFCSVSKTTLSQELFLENLT